MKEEKYPPRAAGHPAMGILESLRVGGKIEGHSQAGLDSGAGSWRPSLCFLSCKWG